MLMIFMGIQTIMKKNITEEIDRMRELVFLSESIGEEVNDDDYILIPAEFVPSGMGAHFGDPTDEEIDSWESKQKSGTKGQFGEQKNPYKYKKLKYNTCKSVGPLKRFLHKFKMRTRRS